jgi:hypothetical protein
MATTPETPPEVNDFLRNTAIAGTVLIPLVMLLPPRKMDIRFFFLAGAFSMSTNYVCYAYTGTSIYTRFSRRMIGFIPGSDLPPEALKTQQLLREHKERERVAAMQQRQKELDEKGPTSIIMDQVADVWKGDWKSGEKNTTTPTPTPSDNNPDKDKKS